MVQKQIGLVKAEQFLRETVLPKVKHLAWQKFSHQRLPPTVVSPPSPPPELGFLDMLTWLGPGLWLGPELEPGLRLAHGFGWLGLSLGLFPRRQYREYFTTGGDHGQLLPLAAHVGERHRQSASAKCKFIRESASRAEQRLLGLFWLARLGLRLRLSQDSSFSNASVSHSLFNLTM